MSTPTHASSSGGSDSSSRGFRTDSNSDAPAAADGPGRRGSSGSSSAPAPPSVPRVQRASASPPGPGERAARPLPAAHCGLSLLLSDVEARSNNMDGLFVKPAVSPDAVDALYSLICKCSEVNEQKVRGVLAKSDVYDVCRTVMKYLKLSDPLLTYSEYTSFLLAQANSDAETRILGFIGAIQRLPSAQLPVTRQLFALLNGLVKREVFKASAESLAYTFGPHLLRKRQPDADIRKTFKDSLMANEVVKSLIVYGDFIFKVGRVMRAFHVSCRSWGVWRHVIGS